LLKIPIEALTQIGDEQVDETGVKFELGVKLVEAQEDLASILGPPKIRAILKFNAHTASDMADVEQFRLCSLLSSASTSLAESSGSIPSGISK